MDFLNKFSFKQKTIGLALLVPLLAFVAWTRAFQATLMLREECNKVEQQLVQAKQASYALKGLHDELEEIEGFIGKSSESATVVQQQLLEHVSTYCRENKLHLKEFPAPESQEASDYLVSTNRFEVEGSFLPLLQLAHELETEFPSARLASVQYHSKLDRKTKKTHLYATYALQNVAHGN